MPRASLLVHRIDWGLRKYSGTQSLVWGGVEGCAHEWDTETRKRDNRYTAGLSKDFDTHTGAGGKFSEKQEFSSSTCLRCGAWYGELGLEPTPELYIEHMVEIFREVRRVLHPSGTVWVNMGDSYNGSGGAGGDYNEGGLKAGQPRYPGRNVGTLKPKDLVGIPWMLAFALRADGWWLRSDIIWSKPNPMPESVTDRPTKAHEYLFLLSKSKKYYYDADAVREGIADSTAKDGRLYKEGYKTGRPERGYPGGNSHGSGLLQPNPAGRNRRTVWTIATKPFSLSGEIAHLRPVPVHEVAGGTIHIILPGCPEHGGHFVPLAREFYDGREGDYWSRIESICDRLLKVPFAYCAPTDQQYALGYEARSLGYFPLSYSPTAIDHNNETHRMAHALDSIPAYIPFFERIYYTDDRRELLSSFVQHASIYGNSILKDDCDGHLLERIPHRIVDKSLLDDSFSAFDTSCSCLFYEYYTTKTDHFATFPPALVEPCIKAGSSEHGVCPRCRNPWRRVVEVVEKGYSNHDGSKRAVAMGHSATGPTSRGSLVADVTTTLGWQPTCDHDLEPVPAVVLDPFIGSGTTCMVARKLGRNSVGLDLSYPYLQLARERLGLTALAEWEQGKDGKTTFEDLPMFERR